MNLRPAQSQMALPIQIISTDFDGTLHSDADTPPVPEELQRLIAELQKRGVKWVINTGRDLSSLMEGIARAHLTIRPDYVVVVEREIYFHHQAQYSGLEDWNGGCTRAHADLFERIRGDVAELFAWVNAHSNATVYEDAYSPFCLLAEDTAQADLIYEYLVSYSQRVPHLTVVRNDVYARFAHAAYNKGTALAEISRQLGVAADRVLAAGDHLNDLPMLSVEYARWLVAPANAISEVKDAVRRQGGYVSHQPHGHGVTRGLEYWFEPVLAELGAGRPKG